MIKFFLGERSRLVEQDLKAVNSLLKQMGSNSPLAEKKQVSGLGKNSYLAIARDMTTGMVVGMAILGVITKLSGKKGLVEDVVVDQNYRGRGLGRKLTEMLIKKARSLRVKSLELTSNPLRVAANHLYQEMGFELRQTNCYRMDLR